MGGRLKRLCAVGFALVLGIAAAGSAQPFGGTWNTTVSVTPSPLPAISSFSTELIATYSVSGWAFSSDTTITDRGWSKEALAVSAPLGAGAVGSCLTLDPTTRTLNSLSVTTGLEIGDITVNPSFNLYSTGTQLRIFASWDVGASYAFVYTTLGDGQGCDFVFNSFRIDFGFPLCCFSVQGSTAFTCSGFQYATFEADDIAISNLPWVSLNAVVRFTEKEKTLTLTPTFSFLSASCINVYMSQVTSGGTSPLALSLQAVELDGIGIQCTVGGAQLTAVSYWGAGTKPSLLAGTRYWEACQIKTTGAACCGAFSFDMTAYFLAGGRELFDVSKLAANVSLQAAPELTVSTGMTIDLDVPTATNWKIGLLVDW